MIWAQIALAVLKLVNLFMGRVDREQFVQQGFDKAFAEQSAQILSKTEWARNVRDKIASMDEDTIDSALRDLEPK